MTQDTATPLSASTHAMLLLGQLIAIIVLSALPAATAMRLGLA